MHAPTQCEARVAQSGFASAGALLWTSFFNLPISFMNFSTPREQTAKQWWKGGSLIHQLSCKWDTNPADLWSVNQLQILGKALFVYNCPWGVSLRCHQIILSITRADGKLLLTDSFLIGFLAISLWLPSLASLSSQTKPMTLEAFALPFWAVSPLEWTEGAFLLPQDLWPKGDHRCPLSVQPLLLFHRCRRRVFAIRTFLSLLTSEQKQIII